MSQSGSIASTSKTSYSYSPTNELTQSGTSAFSYDRAGNIVSMSGTTLSYNVGDELTSTTGACRSKTGDRGSPNNVAARTSSSGGRASCRHRGNPTTLVVGRRSTWLSMLFGICITTDIWRTNARESSMKECPVSWRRSKLNTPNILRQIEAAMNVEYND